MLEGENQLELNVQSVRVPVGSKEIIIETGKMGRQANGAVTVRCGDTIVFVAATMAEPREGVDFFPLTVDYREMTSAAGRFPGGYIKREGRPTEKEILTCRLTDRPIRPLFPDGFFNEVQVIIHVISADDKNDPDVLAMIGASAALAVSDIPTEATAAAVRVGRLDGQLVVNPDIADFDKLDLEMVMAGTADAVTMVEGGGKVIPEQTLIEAIGFGHQCVREIAGAIEELRRLAGKPKITPSLVVVTDELAQKVRAIMAPDLLDRFTIKGKAERNEALHKLHEKVRETFLPAVAEGQEPPAGAPTPMQLSLAMKKVEKDVLRRLAVEQSKRIDGRGLNEVRPIIAEVSVMPRAHGSALFTRGETQSLALATLGGESDEQRSDTLVGEESKKFMLHYNFPPFCTGEVKPIRGPGRREIGHGHLAERALKAVLPTEEEFPYTIRIVSEILESNGSSSMASVCSGSLALMDAGVPAKAPVAGIAMGLIVEGGKSCVLTDILGTEDALGDMDFKLAGTAEGITAFQMDIKVGGISEEILAEAIGRAREGRLHILEKMNAVLAQPRPEMSPYAPRITTIQINPEKIGAVIGPGGKVIRQITGTLDVQIDIEDDGKVKILSNDAERAAKAVKWIEELAAEVEVGKVYRGPVTRILEIGAFVEVLPGQEGMVPISELAEHFVDRVEDEVRVGDEVQVKVTQIDDRGRVNLSRRLALNPDAPERPKRPPRDRDRGDRGGGGGGRRDDRRGGGGRGDDRRGGGGRGGDRRGGGGGPRRDYR
ncbi:MAG: polyribonucleotide nucleotidyltransferase [Verrucomicrobia bacterium]|nr:polyribonucleotide nucleotidyltransferase [Verrucomicrobiota bacterium]